MLYCFDCGKEDACPTCTEQCDNKFGYSLCLRPECISGNLLLLKNLKLHCHVPRAYVTAILKCHRISKEVKDEFKVAYVLYQLSSSDTK